MGLNDMQLSAGLVAGLYPSSIVITDQSENETQPVVPDKTGSGPDQAEWKTLGNNQQKILVVVEHANTVHLPDEDLDFLTGMLAACKLSLDDVLLINYHHYLSYDYKTILGRFGSRQVFLFGLDPLSFGLPVNFPPFQPQQVAGCRFLYAPSLGECRNDKLAKSKLWVCLRNIFGI
jgi:hypothetical protein